MPWCLRARRKFSEDPFSLLLPGFPGINTRLSLPISPKIFPKNVRNSDIYPLTAFGIPI